MIATGGMFGALYLASLLMQLGATMLMTYLALRLNARGVAEFWVGALMAANALGMVFGAKAGHALIGRAGHVRAYAASAGVIVAAVLAHELSASLPFWLLLRAVVGLAMMCQVMVLESWLNERAPSHQRGAVLAVYMVATYAGMILGQLGLAVIGDQGVQALLAVAMAFSLCQVPLAWTRSAPPAASQRAPLALAALLRRVPQALLTVLMSGVLNGSFFGLAAIYARRQGLATDEIGLFMAVAIGAGLLAQLPLGWLSDRMPRVGLIRRVAFLLMFACLPLGFYQGLPLAALLLFGFCIGSLQFCLYPLGAALANERVEPESRVPLAGLLLTTFGIGTGIGPLLAGALMERFGVSSLYYFCAACAAALALVVRGNKGADTRAEPAALSHPPV
ncbi:MAG: MFS transporter [Pseudomonadota bacterium]